MGADFWFAVAAMITVAAYGPVVCAIAWADWGDN